MGAFADEPSWMTTPERRAEVSEAASTAKGARSSQENSRQMAHNGGDTSSFVEVAEGKGGCSEVKRRLGDSAPHRARSRSNPARPAPCIYADMVSHAVECPTAVQDGRPR